MFFCFDNTFGRSCIGMENKRGAITEPCAIPISIFLLDEYVLLSRVQIQLSDKRFLIYRNIICTAIIPAFSVYKVVWHATHAHKPFQHRKTG